MQNMSERLAENAHDIWAKKKKEEMASSGKVTLLREKQLNICILANITRRWITSPDGTV